MKLQDRSRSAARAARLGALVLSCLVASGCAQVGETLLRVLKGPASYQDEDETEARESQSAERECSDRVVYKHHFSERVVVEQAERNASAALIMRLEQDVRRLKSDLDQAEKAVITAESSLSGSHTKAQAVRMLAEARTQIENAQYEAPWRRAESRDAQRKVEEADRQLRAKRYGASILFSSRAKRVAEAISAEARTVRSGKNARQVGERRTRLRAKASGKSKLIATLQPRTPVFLEKVHGHWVLVRTLSSKVGWVPKSALVALPASPAPLP